MNHPFLVGDRIFLRGLHPEDVNGPWLDWFNDQDNTWFMANGVWPTSREGHLAFYDHVRQSKQDLVLAICLKDGDRHIGNLGLHQIDHMNRKAELGIIVGDTTEQTKGVANDAIRLILAHGYNRLNLHKVWLRVDEQNNAARRAFEKVGFRVEGMLRDELYHHRRWSASLYMGVLEDEFFALFPGLLPVEPSVRKAAEREFEIRGEGDETGPGRESGGDA